MIKCHVIGYEQCLHLHSEQLCRPCMQVIVQLYLLQARHNILHGSLLLLLCLSCTFDQESATAC